MPRRAAAAVSGRPAAFDAASARSYAATARRAARLEREIGAVQRVHDPAGLTRLLGEHAPALEPRCGHLLVAHQPAHEPLARVDEGRRQRALVAEPLAQRELALVHRPRLGLLGPQRVEVAEPRRGGRLGLRRRARSRA
jgi:hypothetical protein